MILFWLTIAMSPESRQWSEPEYRRDAERKIFEYKTRKKIFRRIFLITIGERHWTNDCWNRTDRCTDVRIHCISMGSNPSEILCGGNTGFGSDMRCYSGYTCTCVVVGSMAQMTRGCDTLVTELRHANVDAWRPLSFRKLSEILLVEIVEQDWRKRIVRGWESWGCDGGGWGPPPDCCHPRPRRELHGSRPVWSGTGFAPATARCSRRHVETRDSDCGPEPEVENWTWTRRTCRCWNRREDQKSLRCYYIQTSEKPPAPNIWRS